MDITPTKSFWRRFTADDFKIQLLFDDDGDGWRDIFVQEASQGEWLWLRDARDIRFQDNDNVLVSFQKYLVELSIGVPLHVYYPEMGMIIDKATYLFYTREQELARLGQHLDDHKEPMSSAHLQACCEEGHFYLPDQYFLTTVRLRYEHYVSLVENYDKKHAANMEPLEEEHEEEDKEEEEKFERKIKC